MAALTCCPYKQRSNQLRCQTGEQQGGNSTTRGRPDFPLRIGGNQEAGEDGGIRHIAGRPPVTGGESLQPHPLTCRQVGSRLARSGVFVDVAVDAAEQSPPMGGGHDVSVRPHRPVRQPAAGGGGEEVGPRHGSGEVAGVGAVSVALVVDDVVEREVISVVGTRDAVERSGEKADLLDCCCCGDIWNGTLGELV